ncbi:MAG: efflux transporter outer membrane subunit, partial [Caulobacteraceae bacterium]|nr:efflux transporter outer membrane subunit [Caulobacteraceae bacterium]
AADKTDWWTVFGDPTLNELEARVLVSNPTLAAAEAAYRQATAIVREDRAALFPTIGLAASASASGGGGSGGIVTGAGTVSGAGKGTTSSYRVGLNGTWQPDLWGAVRRQIESARASAQASAGTLANARLSAQTELAVDYMALRQYDEDQRILNATLAAYTRNLQITQNRYNAGVAAKSDVLSAETQLENARASDVDLEQQRARSEHAIAILTGAAPAAFALGPAPWTLKTPAIPAELPASLLERRPDIAVAERGVASANALIGVQTAAYFPNITLTGEGDFASASLSHLFDASSAFWSVGASLAETLFDAGARRARVAAARAVREQAVANYRQTVLTAFGQVEDNYAAQRVLGQELAVRHAALAAAEQNVVITHNQYLAGQVDFTTVVVAEASALSARTAEVQIEASRLTTAVDLIAALGGGWTASSLPARP